MVRRITVALVLGSSAFLLAACGGKPDVEKGEPAAGRADVTLHVRDMTERQGIT
jgi:hypothetical protein